MQHFDSDYMEGAHPLILKKLADTNFEKTPGYGLDAYCESARNKIRAACQCPEAEIHFLIGGTQTNATVIDGLLRSYEGVLAADTGHISVHEAGAIETNGHKILTLPSCDGKLSAGRIKNWIDTFYQDGNHEHMVAPGMVYLSHPTEYGTLYTQDELQAISSVCRSCRIPLYLDGARLGYGLAADGTDLTLPAIASLCDAFYIGGTKVGALFGEAVVFPKPGLIPHFFTLVKQHGALLAKGRLLGIQFDTLFTNNLYLDISRNAIHSANRLRDGLAARGYRFLYPPQSNQLFVVLDNDTMQDLAKHVTFSFWEKFDDTHTVVRFATSWATKDEDIDALLRLI